ncbi:Thymidine phosphorylase [Nymphon striatum]|nr:Thymidine phosphorylase [Nymphon striatum]
MQLCDHEEADTRILVHILDALKNGTKSIFVRTVDTDVIVILTGHFYQLTNSYGPLDVWINAMSAEPSFKSIPELIGKKRDGEELSEENISEIIRKIVDGSMEQCQLGAFLMATYIKGLNKRETVALTRQMALQGEVLKWPNEWKGIMVDKHSTGGVGDKTSILLAPALAACGLKEDVAYYPGMFLLQSILKRKASFFGHIARGSTGEELKMIIAEGWRKVGRGRRRRRWMDDMELVPMISGRGLGFTGGTLDKLESIQGFTVACSADQMRLCLEKVGCCIVGQTSSLVPADRLMYACRDVTATVSSIPLVT